MAEDGEPHYSDPQVLAHRAWIRFARGDAAGADRDSERAVALARSSDLQAQLSAYWIRAAVASAGGRHDEASELASEIASFGVGMVAALNSPLQTLVDVAWLFRDLGRESEFSAAVLDPDPIKGPWNDAARAVGDGDLARAADILETIGHTAGAATRVYGPPRRLRPQVASRRPQRSAQRRNRSTGRPAPQVS